MLPFSLRCVHRSEQSPHKHSYTSGSIEDYELWGMRRLNYCRALPYVEPTGGAHADGPQNPETIWCFTTDPSVAWEYCNALENPLIPSDGSWGAGTEEPAPVTESARALSRSRLLFLSASIASREDMLTLVVNVLIVNCLLPLYIRSVKSLS